ncbi:coat protein B [Inoviridae sp.]|nr:coat protein B [Inoviridae sp.]
MKFSRNAVKFGAAVLMTAATAANAALPAGVADAIATAEADGVTLGGLFLGMSVTVGVLFWLKRKAG